MKQLVLYPATVVCLMFGILNQAFGQLNFSIAVTSGIITTTCTDILSTPDPMFSVNIDNAGWVSYPAFGPCFTALPNIQFSDTYPCIYDVPATVQVCVRAFENDPPLFSPCDVVTSCNVEFCFDVPIPLQGIQNVTLDVPPGFASGGSVSFTLTSIGLPSAFNDEICDALDIGILAGSTTVGDADTSIFSNFCGTFTNEPNPGAYGAPWVNNRGVWYKFTTGPDPGTHIRILARSDPSNFGDPVNLQVGVFSATNNDCNGPYQLVAHDHHAENFDELLYLTCPQPNTAYFILVDAVSGSQAEVEGYFGIEITEMGVSAAPDLRCEAVSFGAVPEGGTVNTTVPYTNACSSNANAANAQAFTVQKSVWFSFQTPPSGHVIINAVSDVVDDPINIQLGVYQSSNNTCSGTFSEVESIYDIANNDETMELHCLDPNLTYYIMIDGTQAAFRSGIFSISIEDAGDETVTLSQNITLCAGETLAVGSSVYAQSGSFQDTIVLPSGCDSIVLTQLTVLTPLVSTFAILEEGLGIGNTDGVAQVAPSGGTGTYSILWSDGQTTPIASSLIGGDNYCVTVTDGNNCLWDTCFEMTYFVHFVPTLVTDTLDCFGDSDGILRLTAEGGVAPYNFTWQNAANTLSGSGAVAFDGQVVTLPNLPAGTYSFHMVDIFFDTIFSTQIIQPTALKIADFSIENAACFSQCNGSIQVTPGGGTPPYQLDWSNGESSVFVSDLCNGNYILTLTDANGCTAIFDYDVTEPAEFIALAEQEQGVSCFEGSDGEANVTTNGSPSNYDWSNGDGTAAITNLQGGMYAVTVTNQDGCTATASVTISTPTEPVGVSVSVLSPVVCKDDSNGELQATVSGPGANFTYDWNTGDLAAVAENLSAGNYSVTVSNEKGCTASDNFTLSEPTEINATASANKLSCFDDPDAGIIMVETVTGGEAPYLFAADGFNFLNDSLLTGYTAGTQAYFVEDALGCVRQFSATIEGPTEIVVEAGDDIFAKLGDDVQLNSTSNLPGLLTYAWLPAEWLSCADCPDPIAKPLETVRLHLVVTDTFGCTASDDMLLTISKPRHVFVPNAFSPNGDGINDEFVPFAGNDVTLIKTMKIFDRQGNMVFSSANFFPSDSSKGWKGDFGGKEMQPAVFAWFAEIVFLDGVTQLLSGDVALMK